MWGSAAVVVAVALLWANQRRFIYLPDRSVPAVPAGVEVVPYLTEDGLAASGWFVAADGEPKGTVLVFPGNAGNRAHRMPLAEGLSRRGYAVFLVDYRGYGANPGRPSERGLAADARAAVAALEGRADVDPGRIVYFGESLGAGVAVGLAVEREPAALVLRSPFTSLPDVASAHYPLAGVVLWDRFPNLERVQVVEVPVVVVAGPADRIVPFEQSLAVFEAVSGPKRLVVVDGAGHNDAALVAGSRMLDEVVAFLDEVVGS